MFALIVWTHSLMTRWKTNAIVRSSRRGSNQRIHVKIARLGALSARGRALSAPAVCRHTFSIRQRVLVRAIRHRLIMLEQDVYFWTRALMESTTLETRLARTVTLGALCVTISLLGAMSVKMGTICWPATVTSGDVWKKCL